MNAALRIAATTLLMSVVVVTTSGAARAESTDSTGFGDLADSRGITVDRFTIDLNDGNRLNPADSELLIWSVATRVAWETYRHLMSLMIWLLDWVLQLTWVEWLLTPLRGLSDVTESVVDAIGLTPLMLTVLALVVAYWWMKGRYAGGLTELFIGVTIAALATGALANPMATVAGPDGLLYTGRDAGLDFATAVTSDGENLEGETIDPSITTAAMVDALIRIPHQVVNYGAVIDGGPCESTYDSAVGDGLREQIGGCDESLRQYSDAPDEATVAVATSLLPSGTFFTLFSTAIALVLAISVLMAGWAAIKMLWQLVFGVVSGAMRGALFQSFADAIAGAAMVAAATVFCVAWMKLLIAFHSTVSDDVPWIMRMYLLNGLMLVGAVVIFMIRSRVKRSLRNAAAKLAALGPSPSKAPEPSRLPGALASNAGRLAKDVWLHRRLAGSAARGAGPSPTLPPPAPQPNPVNVGPVRAYPVSSGGGAGRTGPTPARVGPGEQRLAIGAGSGGPGPSRPEPGPGPVGPSGRPRPGGSTGPSGRPAAPSASRLLSRVGTGLQLAAHGAALVASGGSSAAVSGSQLIAATMTAGQVASAAGALSGARGRPLPKASQGNQLPGPTSAPVAPSTVRMRAAGRLSTDTATGVTYRRSSVTTASGRVEVLQPAARLRERLRTTR